MRLPPGIRRLFRVDDVRPGAGGDVDEELRYHLDRLVREGMARGMGRAEAEARARSRFGDVEAYRRALEHIDGGREQARRRIEMLDVLTRTLAQALRGLWRSPAFTLAVAAILALGLGANAVMFGVVDRLLLSPPDHVEDPGRVRLLYLQRHYQSGRLVTERTMTFPDYGDFGRVGAFASVAAVSGPDEETLGRGVGARPVRVMGASPSFFPLLGVRPVLGRFYSADEDAPGAPATAVVSYEMWDRDFGRDPGVLGRTLDLGPTAYTVVGVASRGFTGAGLERVDVWVPLELHEAASSGTEWRDSRSWWWLHVVARLADGATDEAAAVQATAAHRRGRQDAIDEGRYDSGARILVAPLIAAQGPDPSAESRVARWLAGVSGIVLLIACFNVANLLLARTTQRRREIAVRVALGVSRVRLLGELLVQSLLLAMLGAAGALAFAQASGQLLQRVLLPDVVFGSALPSPRLLVFLAVATVLTTLLSGLVPALHATRSDVAASLKSDAGGGRSRARARRVLLVAQAALSVVLLVGAGLFVKSLRNARGLDLGFDARHVVVAQLEWNETLPASRRTAIYREALERVRRIPGVRAAGLTYTVPFASSVSIGRPRIPGLDSVPRHPNGGPYANKVSSGYFEAMGLAILQGRGFEPADDADEAPPVTVVTRGMAAALWPAGNALGSCMLLGTPDEDPPCTEVVGIVEDHRRENLVEDDPHWLYFLNEAHPAFRGPPQGIMLGTDRDASRVAGAVQAELRSLQGPIRFASAQSLQSNVEPQLRSWTLGAAMFSAFGILALVVAGWGLYTVLAFEVALRRRELGIRSALGAGIPRLVRMVLAQALALVGAGVAVGALVAMAAARSVGPLLFSVSPWDPTVYETVAATLLVVAAGAGVLPAWRATRIDPKEALQAE